MSYLQTTSGESSYSSEHVANIDRLRIFAAFGIVWLHTESVAGRGIGYSGIIIFLLVFCSLIVTHSELHGAGHFATRRARRVSVAGKAEQTLAGSGSADVRDLPYSPAGLIFSRPLIQINRKPVGANSQCFRSVRDSDFDSEGDCP